MGTGVMWYHTKIVARSVQTFIRIKNKIKTTKPNIDLNNTYNTKPPHEGKS